MSVEKIILTGLPRSGKTTLLEKIVNQVSNKQGFLTREIRENGERVGFESVTAQGLVTRLADVDSTSGLRVGRYGVEVDNLEKLLPQLLFYKPQDLLYIDEIGQMELFSQTFRKVVHDYLISPNKLIATMSVVFEDSLIEEIRRDHNVKLWEVNNDNREMLYRQLELTVLK